MRCGFLIIKPQTALHHAVWCSAVQYYLWYGAVMSFCGWFWCGFCGLCGLVNTTNSMCFVYVTFFSFKFSLIVYFSRFRWHECFVGCQACAHVSVWTLGKFVVQTVLLHFRHVCSKWSTPTVQFWMARASFLQTYDFS